MNIISYPENDDEEFQSKIYAKREYYSNRIPELPELKTYKDIKKYRDNACMGSFKLQPYQSFLSNFINPNTPFTGVLITHGAGSGKSAGAIAICENFKPMLRKYNSKVYILVPGPLNKESWKRELIKVTGNTYIGTNPNQALQNVLQFYKIMSYRGFYKKVLGQKIIEKKIDASSKKSYRKTEEGEYERDISIDKLTNLNNTILVVDEAHNLTGNEYGLALQKIISNSSNLRLVLLTATPMKNLGDDIIELLNYLRPKNDKIQRDKIFTVDTGHLMQLKPNGIEYLKKMAQGYVSYYRGINPLTYAIQKDEGTLPESIQFTPMIRCHMEKFQLEAYNKVIKEINDALERKSTAIANFAIPCLDNNKEIIASSGREGIRIIKNQLNSNKTILLTKIKNKFFPPDTNINDIIVDTNVSLSGLIFKQPYLKNFSVKFDKCLSNLLELVNDKCGTAFVYSNLVKSGIEFFEQILLMNGFLEYNENANYDITDNILDYKTGICYGKFKDKKHFFPATYIKITGKSDEIVDIVTDEKTKILDNVFSNIDNAEGKYIKFVLGSKVMNEGITLRNVKQVHILDVYYNLGKVYQVIGRAIRHCVHNDIMTEENPYVHVSVFRYTVSLDQGLSTEEELYKKAENKYILIKNIERALKEVAVDCPLNYNGNIIKEEVETNKNCIIPDGKSNKNICPISCDFNKCDYICNDKTLNFKYYDKDRKIYKRITKEGLDYTTFNNELAINEIDNIKLKIKKLYKHRYVYTLEELVDLCASAINSDLFDVFFVYKAIDELIPISENDFNNFTDIIYDKYNVAGYIIYRDKYYIFQPFNKNEDVLMYYRTNYDENLHHEISVRQYLDINNIKLTSNDENIYTYSLDYYDNKTDNDYVGIIDKESNKRRNLENLQDIFKLRIKRDIISNKKRGLGINSDKGIVCSTKKKKKELESIAKKIGVSKINNITRFDICNVIKLRLLYLEKYSNDNITYMIVPNNHEIYEFPFNLLDRIEYYKDKINIILPHKTEFIIDKLKGGKFDNKVESSLTSYNLKFSYDKSHDKFCNNIKDLGFILDKKMWVKKFE